MASTATPRTSLLSRGSVNGAGWFIALEGVPAFTTLVKSFVLNAAGGTQGGVTLWIADAGTSVQLWQITTALNGIYVYQAPIVLRPGGNLTLQLLSATQLKVLATGSYLQGEQPSPPQTPRAGLDLELG